MLIVAFASSAGATLNVDCENSLRAPTVGILFLGFQRAQLPTHFGGDLLLLPALCVPITFSLKPTPAR